MSVAPVLVGCFRDTPENMRRALASVAGRVSAVCISCDPGYPADVWEIREACDEVGIDHVNVYFTTRTNGSELRSEIMRVGEEFARSIGAEYVVNLDSDDWLEFEPGFEWPSGGACYSIEECAGHFTYPFPRVFRVGLGWKWWRPYHEEPYCDEVPREMQTPVLRGVTYVKGGLGPRAPEPYVKHAEALRGWLVEHPEDHSAQFYLARSLRDARQLPEAIGEYERYLARADGFQPQRYVAAMDVCACAVELSISAHDMVMLLTRVISIAPERAEPWRMMEIVAASAAERLPVPEGAILLNRGAYGKRAVG